MKKRRRWHRIKSKVKNLILGTITVFAFMMLVASLDALFEQTVKATLIFLISLAWMVLFCHANKDTECP